MEYHNNEDLHPIKASTYITVFMLLATLTALTLIQPLVLKLALASTLTIQLGIAFMKAFLIVAYYMHIKSNAPLFRILIYGSLAILGVVYIIMAIDTYYRYTPNDLFLLPKEG